MFGTKRESISLLLKPRLKYSFPPLSTCQAFCRSSHIFWLLQSQQVDFIHDVLLKVHDKRKKKTNLPRYFLALMAALILSHTDLTLQQ